MSRRYSYYEFYEPAPLIHTDQGIKAHSQQGKIGRTWWAERWIAALEQFVDAGRLRRGRSYARSGQVLSISEAGNTVKAKVQGSRTTPYKVTISVSALTGEQWERVIDQMATQAAFAAQLLAGEMPADIEEAFQAAGVSLFPHTRDDLVTDCTCPDWSNPCKHVAATHYILGEQFDEDPFMLFRLRGRSQEQILEALRARRAGSDEAGDEHEEDGQAEPELIVPLEDLIESYWQPGERLDAFPTSIKEPAVRLPLLKRLGQPSFLPAQDLQALLAPAYEAITRAALGAAFDGDEAADNE